MNDEKQTSFILGKLDKKTLLVATSRAFVIKERVKAGDGEVGWTSKYFYSEIGDAIRGYARHLLRRPSTAKHLDGDIKTLIDVIGKLEKTIKKVGDKLNLQFAERLQDPVESHILNAGDNP
jgi:hypothetical protein